jgi:hypothetical protein
MAELTTTTSVSTGDGFVLYKGSETDFQKASSATVLAWIQAGLTFPAAGRAEPVTQRYSPAATAFSVTITDGDDDNADVHLILTPLAGYADGTIVLPLSTSLRDKQLVIVNCTQAVATLVVSGNGATVVGAPTAFLANGYFTLEYDLAMATWYRIG